MHVEPEAEYTDAACVPYTASALAIGEESIYAAFGVDPSRSGRGEDTPPLRRTRRRTGSRRGFGYNGRTPSR